MRGALDLRRLRYFLAVCRHGSISAAARALNLAQPALSYHVSELERLLGQTVFERGRCGVDLTVAGKLLHAHAREIVDKVDAAEDALYALARRRAPRRRLRLAIISSLAADLTPILVETMGRELPEISLRITEAGTRDIQQKLDRGEADLAIYLASTHGPGELPLATEQLFFIAPAGETLAAGTMPFSQVATRQLVMPAPGNPLRAFIDNIARQNGLTLDVVLEVDGTGSRRNAVLNGMGCTILGAHSVRSEKRDTGLSVCEIVEPRLFRPIYLGACRDLDPALMARMKRVLSSTVSLLGLNTLSTRSR